MLDSILNVSLLKSYYNLYMVFPNPQAIKNVLATDLLLEHQFNFLSPITKTSEVKALSTSDSGSVAANPEKLNILLTQSDSLKTIQNLLEKISPPPFQKESTSFLLKMHSEHPDLILANLDFLQNIPEKQKLEVYPLALQVLQKNYETVRSQIAGKSEPESLGYKQEFIQTLRQLKQVMEVVQQLPQLPSLTSTDLEPFSKALVDLPKLMQFVLKSTELAPQSNLNPSEELFSLAIFFKSKFTPEEFLLAAQQESPLKIALIILEAAKHDERAAAPPLLQQVLRDLKSSLPHPEQFTAKVNSWLEKLKVPLPELFSQNALPNLRSLREGFIQSSLDTPQQIPLQALSPELGYIPPELWNIQPSISTLSLQGSLLLLRHMPIGLIGLKFEVQNPRRKSKAQFNLFTFLTENLLSEQSVEAKKQIPKEDLQAIPDSYQLCASEKQSSKMLLGSLAFALDAPVFLTEAYSGKKLKDPERFEFYFLIDWVQGDKRYARKDFLTLAESPESQKFRQAIRDLNHLGMPAYEAYQKALKDFLGKIKRTLPGSEETWKEAERFLQSEVEQHLKGEDSHLSQQHMMEGKSGANLVASILRKTGQLCEQGEQFGEALLHFAEASRGKDLDSSSLMKLENLLQHLRRRFLKSQNYESEEWVTQQGLAPRFLQLYHAS